MKRNRGLSWDNAKKYIAAGVIAAMMAMPSVAMAKPSKSTKADGKVVNGPIMEARSVSWS